jgi:hypothetical protein
MKAYGQSGCIDPCFLELGNSWRWVVSLTVLLLYPQGKSPRYPLHRRFGGPQNRSGRNGEVEILGPAATRILTPRFTNLEPDAIPTALPRLLVFGVWNKTSVCGWGRWNVWTRGKSLVYIYTGNERMSTITFLCFTDIWTCIYNLTQTCMGCRSIEDAEFISENFTIENYDNLKHRRSVDHCSATGIKPMLKLLYLFIEWTNYLFVDWLIRRPTEGWTGWISYGDQQTDVQNDHLCGLVVRVLGYRTEMYYVSCEIRTQFI